MTGHPTDVGSSRRMALADGERQSASGDAVEPTFASGPGLSGLVSIVIPTYNRAHIVGRAIDSVLRQSYADVEIIVVDDGSTDETASVVEGYGCPVRYVRQLNRGVSAARNTGLALARGEFIALLDSDDEWLPWKLSAQIALLDRIPDVGMVWTDMRAVDAGGREFQPTYLRSFYSAYAVSGLEAAMDDVGILADYWSAVPDELARSHVRTGEIFSRMMLGNHVHTSTVLMRRDRLRAVGLFDEGLRHAGEDYEFHLRTTFHGPVAMIDASSIRYRVGAEDQLTQPAYAIHIARNNLTTVQRWFERGRDKLDLPRGTLLRRLASSYAWVGECELKLGNRTAACRALGRSLIHAPDWRVAQLLAASLLPSSLEAPLRTLRRHIKALVKP